MQLESVEAGVKLKEKKALDRTAKKLTLLTHIQQLHSCSQQNDFLSLKHLLNHTADLYNELCKDKKVEEEDFLFNMRKIHDTYAKELLK